MAFPKSLVIVPTYNEKENILLIMSAILEQNDCLEILVVDDGSPDGTGDLVQAEAPETADSTRTTVSTRDNHFFIVVSSSNVFKI